MVSFRWRFWELTKGVAVGFGGGLAGPNYTREVGSGTARVGAFGVEGLPEGPTG